MEVTGQQELTNFFKTHEMMMSTVNTFSNVVLKSVDLLLRTGDPLAKEMGKQLRNGNVSTVETESRADALNLQNALRNEGAFHSMAVSVDGRNFVLIHESEVELAQKTINRFYNERSRGGSIDMKTFGRYADQEANIVENMNEQTAQMMAYRCEQQHIPIVTQGPNENNKYNVLFAERDADKMSAILNTVAIDMAGEHGKLVTRQLQWESAYRTGVLNNILNGKYSDGSQIEPGAALVDRNGNEIEVKKNALIIRESGREESIAKSREKNIEREVKATYCDMDRPVLLTRDQFNEFKKTPKEKRDDFLIDVERKSGRPVLSTAEMQIIADTEAKRASIQRKLSQSFYGSSSETQNPYNTEQSFWGFKEAERENYQDMHDRSEAKYADGEFLNEANAMDDGLVEAVHDLREDLQPFETEIPLSSIVMQSSVLDSAEVGTQDFQDVDFGYSDRDAEMSINGLE